MVHLEWKETVAFVGELFSVMLCKRIKKKLKLRRKTLKRCIFALASIRSFNLNFEFYCVSWSKAG